jgi:hypothetical protein
LPKFLRFTFEREAKWLLVFSLLVPLVGILLAIIIPGLIRRLFS